MSDHLKYFAEHLPTTFVYAGVDVERCSSPRWTPSGRSPHGGLVPSETSIGSRPA
jgi:hypothetical protein